VGSNLLANKYGVERLDESSRALYENSRPPASTASMSCRNGTRLAQVKVTASGVFATSTDSRKKRQEKSLLTCIRAAG